MNRSDIRGGLDTTFLVRLLTGVPAGQAELARAYLAEVEEAGAAVRVSSLVVAETYFACQYHYGLAKKVVLAALRSTLSKPTFVLPGGLIELLEIGRLASAKPGFVDRLIHHDYRVFGAPLITFEKAAKRLPDAIVLDA